MSTFFSLGLQGVADQDRAKAVVYQIDGALAGFKPSAWRLQQLLAQVSRPPRGAGERAPPRPIYGAEDYRVAPRAEDRDPRQDQPGSGRGGRPNNEGNY
jgi:hypothetical protein